MTRDSIIQEIIEEKTIYGDESLKPEVADCWDIPSHEKKSQSRDIEIPWDFQLKPWDPHPGIFENIPGFPGISQNPKKSQIFRKKFFHAQKKLNSPFETYLKIKKKLKYEINGVRHSWEIRNHMGDCPHGRFGQMGKWALMGKMNPDGKKRTKIEKRIQVGKK